MSKKNQNSDKKTNEPEANIRPENPSLTDGTAQTSEQSTGQSPSSAPKEEDRDREKSKGPRKPLPRRKDVGPSEFVEQVVSINRITKVTKG